MILHTGLSVKSSMSFKSVLLDDLLSKKGSSALGQVADFKTMFCKNKLIVYSNVSVKILIFFGNSFLSTSAFHFPKHNYFMFTILYFICKEEGERMKQGTFIKRKSHNSELLHLASGRFRLLLRNLKHVFQIAYGDSSQSPLCAIQRKEL